MMPVSGLRLDPLVPVPDHVVVEHVDEPVHRDACEAALVEELLPETAEEPLRGGVVRGTALRARRPYQAVPFHEVRPSGAPAVASRGRNAPRASPPSGSVSAALTGIPSASPASGPEPAVHATIPPSWQSTGGERHALPVPGLDPG